MIPFPVFQWFTTNTDFQVWKVKEEDFFSPPSDLIAICCCLADQPSGIPVMTFSNRLWLQAWDERTWEKNNCPMAFKCIPSSKKGRRRHGCNWGILQQTSKMDIRDSYDFSGQFQTRMLRILSLSFLMELWSTSIRTRLVALQQQLGLEEELSWHEVFLIT